MPFYRILDAFELINSKAVIMTQIQDTHPWDEKDRKYLADNLIRSRDELIAEAKGLTEAQWRFKESFNRWSINQVVEHIAIYELMFQRQMTQTLASGPQPELKKLAKPDSMYLNYVLEPTSRLADDFTKPFTYADPIGLNDGKNNLTWFLKMRNESIDYVKSTSDDLRAYYLQVDRPNVHQLYIWTFGHVDRSLRQIRKIKQSIQYPK
jgi:hypothetical protein